MTPTPVVSIIVPVYNAEKYLHRCIDSILAQTFTDWELLLIDDGSMDRSGQICDEYAAKDERIRIFHKENGGVSSARNLGLDYAQGEWVTFVDSDDYLELFFLESMIVEKSADLIIGKCKCVNDTEEILYENEILLDNLSRETILEEHLYSILFTVPWGKLFRLAKINENRIRYNERMRFAEDLCFVYQYLLYAKDIRKVKSVFSYNSIVHFVPNDIIGKYAMTSNEAASHFSFVWNAYTQLKVHCKTFEERMINDIFELCKKDSLENPSPWYENESVQEAYYFRAKTNGVLNLIKVFFVIFMKLYKLKYLSCRIIQRFQ